MLFCNTFLFCIIFGKSRSEKLHQNKKKFHYNIAVNNQKTSHEHVLAAPKRWVVHSGRYGACGKAKRSRRLPSSSRFGSTPSAPTCVGDC